MKIKVVSDSENTTKLIAKKYAQSIKSPCVISLVGDLGAGKTTFAKGFAEGFGVKDVVTSPTFTIMNEYMGSKMPMYHFDMYRVESWDSLYSTGFFDYLNDNSILFVEWSENIEGVLPENTIFVDISRGENDTERKIEISAGDSRW